MRATLRERVCGPDGAAVGGVSPGPPRRRRSPLRARARVDPSTVPSRPVATQTRRRRTIALSDPGRRAHVSSVTHRTWDRSPRPFRRHGRRPRSRLSPPPGRSAGGRARTSARPSRSPGSTSRSALFVVSATQRPPKPNAIAARRLLLRGVGSGTVTRCPMAGSIHSRSCGQSVFAAQIAPPPAARSPGSPPTRNAVDHTARVRIHAVDGLAVGIGGPERPCAHDERPRWACEIDGPATASGHGEFKYGSCRVRRPRLVGPPEPVSETSSHGRRGSDPEGTADAAADAIPRPRRRPPTGGGRERRGKSHRAPDRAAGSAARARGAVAPARSPSSAASRQCRAD